MKEDMFTPMMDVKPRAAKPKRVRTTRFAYTKKWEFNGCEDCPMLQHDEDSAEYKTCIPMRCGATGEPIREFGDFGKEFEDRDYRNGGVVLPICPFLEKASISNRKDLLRGKKRSVLVSLDIS